MSKHKKRKIVMCAGKFDMIHPGHIAYFEEAKTYGNYLVVVVARNITVEKETGKKPLINDELDRLRLVSHLDLVDKAVLGNIGNKLKIIEEVKPDVICLGYDQEIDEKKLKEKINELGLGTEIKRLNAYKNEFYKSSKLRVTGSRY